MNCIDVRFLGLRVGEKLRIAKKEMQIEKAIIVNGMRHLQDKVRLALINKTITSALEEAGCGYVTRPFEIALFELGEE